MSVLPDPEALGVEALKAVSAVTSLVGGRISTRLPATYPSIRLTVVGGTADPEQNWGNPILQWEAWGDGIDGTAESQACGIAQQIQAAASSLTGTYTAGRVVGCYPEGHYAHSPDRDTGQERYLGHIGLLIQP